jgi:hypothetical protein
MKFKAVRISSQNATWSTLFVPRFYLLFAASKEAWYELEAPPLSAAPFSLYLVSFPKKNDSLVEGRGFIASDIVATP